MINPHEYFRNLYNKSNCLFGLNSRVGSVDIIMAGQPTPPNGLMKGLLTIGFP